MGQGEVGGVTCRVLCTWKLLGSAVKGPWLVPGEPILTMNRLRKCYSHLSGGGSFLTGEVS